MDSYKVDEMSVTNFYDEEIRRMKRAVDALAVITAFTSSTDRSLVLAVTAAAYELAQLIIADCSSNS